ncbi:VWA domain-containing protein [candidate division WOR-3 bacterium]|nr:VWA domain-containing protein [candidate division WOR-3 bacterium]
MKGKFLTAVLVPVVLASFFCTPKEIIKEKVDDWQYSVESYDEDEEYLKRSFGGAQMSPTVTYSSAPMVLESADDGIGFSVGGAKDINNFRENIENGYLPLPTDITVEGIYYDYFFETGQTEPCEELFCPSYSKAVSMDPFTGEPVYYLSVGLNSGMKESDFSRKKLNLVVVIDISGSMSSPFDRYYYDRFGSQQESQDTADFDKSKMEIANRAVVELLDHLGPDDRLGIVLFDDRGYLAKPLRRVDETDMESIKGHVLEIEPMGGTNMEAGMFIASTLYDSLESLDRDEYENRVIFLTDAMPNTGSTDENSLFGMFEKNSERGVFTTFIGVGVDLNTELVEILTKIKGANYFSVHSPTAFKEQMDDNFDYMVTPLVFDLELVLESDGYEIEKVYGSPEANLSTGEIMKVNTLFPSKRVEGETRGGLVLLRLKKTSGDARISLGVSYEDRNGVKDENSQTIEFGGSETEYYDNSGIRKGILLARFVELVKSWLTDQRAEGEYLAGHPMVSRNTGIIVYDEKILELGRWERQSMGLEVSSHYTELFEDFHDYFMKEAEAIGDTALSRELDVLKKLSEM